MIAIFSAILILTALFWTANRILKGNLFCPICAATALVWLAALAASFIGVRLINNSWLAILMAISLGAVIQKYGGKFGLLWKTAAVVFGGPAVYFLSQQDLRGLYFAVAMLFITVLSEMKFTSKPAKGLYKDKFDNCCD